MKEKKIGGKRGERKETKRKKHDLAVIRQKRGGPGKIENKKGKNPYRYVASLRN